MDALRSPACAEGWYAIAERLEPQGIRCRSDLHGERCETREEDRRGTPFFALFVFYVVCMEVAAGVYFVLWWSLFSYAGYKQTGGSPVTEKIGKQKVSMEEIAYVSLSVSLLLLKPAAPAGFLAVLAAISTAAWRMTFARNVPVLHLLSIVATALSIAAVSLCVQDGEKEPHPGVLTLSLVSLVMSVIEHGISHGRDSFSLRSQLKDENPLVLLSMSARKQLLAAAGAWAATLVVSHPSITQRPD